MPLLFLANLEARPLVYRYLPPRHEYHLRRLLNAMKKVRYEDLTFSSLKETCRIKWSVTATIALGAIVNDSTIAAFYSKGRYQGS